MNSNVLNSNSMSQTNSNALKKLAQIGQPVGESNDILANNGDNFQQVLASQMQPSASEPLSADEAQALLAEMEGTETPPLIDPAQLLQDLGIAQSITQSTENTQTNALPVLDTTAVASALIPPFLSNSALQSGLSFKQSLNPVNNSVNSTATSAEADLGSLPTNDQSIATSETPDAMRQLFTQVLETKQPLDQRFLALEGNNRQLTTQNLQVEAAMVDLAKQDAALPIPQQSNNNPLQVATTQSPITQPIMEYPGKSGWDQAIGQRVMMMVNNAQQSATISLNPPELGPLEIVISVNNDQADTTFLSDRKEVRQALQDGMENLREMMKESGISLGQTNIGGRNQQAQAENQTSQRNVNSALKLSAETKQESTLNMLNTVRTRLGNVDTFV